MQTRNRDRKASVAAFVLLAGAALGQRSPGDARKATMSIDVKAEMGAETFLVEQTVPVRLTLENHRERAARVADPFLNETNPEYLITRPDGSRVTVTHTAARAPGPVRDPEAPPVTATMDLAPGAKWSELVPLDRMLPLTTPGVYGLQVAFTIDGQRVVTSEARFKIAPANVTAFAATPQGAYSREARLSTAWAHSDASGTAVIDAVRLGRRWGDDRTGKLYSHVVHRGGRASIRQIAVPAMYADRGMDFVNWVVWIDGGRVQAQRTQAGKAAGDAETLYSTDANLWLVDPPVMDAGHRLSVFLVESRAARAELLRLDLERATPSAPKTVYRVSLPGLPVAAQALHFRANGIDRSLIFSVAAAAGQMVIAVVPDAPSPAAVILAQLGDERPLRGRPLSVYSIDGGETFAACALAPAKNGVVRIITAAVRANGESTGQAPAQQIALGDKALLEWGSLAASPAGAHLLWRDGQGRLQYCSTRFPPARLTAEFKADPLPGLLIGDGAVFLAGVRAGGPFGIEQITRRILEH